ncbi:MAG: ABC transporter permease [Clostridiales bacterium]|nr:ABC transporter permease [Clostridiales bacterium]
MMQKLQGKSAKELLMQNGFFIVMILVFVFFSVTTNNFCTVSNVFSIIHSAAPDLIYAVAAGWIIMMGMTDLSIGSVMYLTTAVFTILYVNYKVPLGVAFAIGILCGLMVGAINGLIVVRLHVNAMIATMGTQIIFRGVARTILGGLPLALDSSVTRISSMKFGVIYLDSIFAVVILILIYMLHRKTKFGRYVTAIGNSDVVAGKLGIDVPKVVFVSFLLSALLAAIGGLVLEYQVAGVTLAFGSGKEFTAIAICVIGGFSMYGGKGDMLKGVLLGAMTLKIIEAGLNFMGASPYAYKFVQGGIIFVAMYALSYQEILALRNRRLQKD